MLQELIGTASETNTVLLLAALVILFVVAFKLLEMVMQTVLVTALSGIFYFAFTYFVSSVSFSLNTMLFFAFTGGTLYTVYSLLTKSYKATKLLLYIPIKLLKMLKALLGTVFNFDRNSKKKQE